MTGRHLPMHPHEPGEMEGEEGFARPTARAALARGGWFFGFWLLLAGPGVLVGLVADPPVSLVGDLLVGFLAAVAATWVSLRLLPPSRGRVQIGALVKLIAHFLWQSMIAGVDVARRAFAPRLPLKPGLVNYSVGIPAGTGRAAFGAVTALMPGTLPVGTNADGTLVYHCLDSDQPVVAALARDEMLMVRAWRGILG